MAQFIPTEFLDATPDGWCALMLSDGTPAYDRPADDRDAFATIGPNGEERVMAMSAEDARRIDAERSH